MADTGGSGGKWDFYNKNIRPFTQASRRRKKDQSWRETDVNNPNGPF